MESQNPPTNQNLYQEIIQSNPNSNPSYSSYPTPSAPSLYPSLDYTDLHQHLFIDPHSHTPIQSSEEVILKIPNSIIHLIDKQQSIELASGVLEIVRLRQGNDVVAVLARIDDFIQWPLTKDSAAMKLDGSHYFFTLRVPSDLDSGFGSDNLLNYGVTVTGQGLGEVLGEFDRVLDEYSAFSVKQVEQSVVVKNGGGTVEEKAAAAAYWTVTKK